jgi:predicted dehydrogenase
MQKKIRLGFIGANVDATWASQSHYPALMASPDVELTAVCTTRPESARAARDALGARLAFSDYRAMVHSSEIDAVVVVVRVPAHYAPTRAAIEAGKPVYTEWPLGRNTAEAEELTALALARGVPTAIGLQSRVSPALLHMKELIDTGYVGRVMACNVATIRDGAAARPSTQTWMGDATQGANTFTIGNGHVIDALRFVAGDFARVSGLLSTQARQWLETDTGRTVDVTSPDNVLVHGELATGAVASVHVGAAPWAGCGYRMEIYGTEGTLMATGTVSSQRGPMLRLLGAHRSKELRDLPVPSSYARVPADFPQGDPYNVGQMYALFAEAIRERKTPTMMPNFETALHLHKFLDVIQQSSDSGRALQVP